MPDDRPHRAAEGHRAPECLGNVWVNHLADTTHAQGAPQKEVHEAWELPPWWNEGEFAGEMCTGSVELRAHTPSTAPPDCRRQGVCHTLPEPHLGAWPR